MPPKLRPRFLIFVLTFSVIQKLYSQTYPSALVTAFTNPKSIFLDDYADPFKPRIKTTIYFTDYTESSWQFNLRLKISGPNGIIIQSKPGVKPASPFIVAPGQPMSIDRTHLAFLFSYNNLNFTGISKAQLELNNRLPEGYYTFCFEALDYESGKPLSHPACAGAYLSLNDPAIILKPTCGSVVENISMQNILFQWQVGNANGNLDLTQLIYVINLYEVNNSWSNPITAIINNQALPVWESQPLQQNTYLYNNTDPPLEKGKRYVFTVKTIENNGRSSFKNNGYSMPCYFHYGYFENDTVDIILPADNFQFTLSTPSQFKWKKPRRAMPGQMVTYNLKLVAVNEDQDPANAIIANLPFYNQTYLATSLSSIDKTIPVTIWGNVKRSGKYAWQVFAQSGTQQVAKSAVHTFIGPPEIETFIAGGFLMKVTKLDLFNKNTNTISGRCKTNLNAAWGGVETEFAFMNIIITPIGNNEWVMVSGKIADKIITPSYTLSSQTNPENGKALFKTDSIYVTSAHLKLSGKIEWQFPHASPALQLEKITSARCLLSLANGSYFLNNNYPVTLDRDYALPLLEPYGFEVKLAKGSEINVYQSKFEWSFRGFVQMPANVLSVNNSPALISFQNASQLFYISENGNQNSQPLKLSQNSGFGFRPVNYIIDLSESKSPGKFSTDNLWKGLYIEHGILILPQAAESSGQISLPVSKQFTFNNTVSDTNKALVTNRGLSLSSRFAFQWSDTVRFNGFTTRQGAFSCVIKESEVVTAHIKGGILIPVIDTLNTFPYQIDLTTYGFNEGYLSNGLAGQQFTFNPAGSVEQRIPITIKRAVLRGRNRIETDIDLSWPHFNLNLQGVNGFCIWGNGNISFDSPNGKSSVTYQSGGKASGFDITVDRLGCGRNGNAYAFGASAKINMDEEISGETGPPVINAYSLYKNPLLSGTFVTTPISSTSPGGTVNNNSYQSSTASNTAAINAGLNESIAALGYQPGDTPNNGQDSKPLQPLISENIVKEIKTIIDIAYKLKPFINTGTVSDKEWIVLDRFRNALDNDIVQQSQLTNAKGLLNFILNKVVDGIISRINQPITNISNQCVGKVRTAVNNLVTEPVNTRIDNFVSAILNKIQQKVLLQTPEDKQEAVIMTFSLVRTNLITGIKNSVSQSVESNITSKAVGFVELGVTAKITGFVRTEVSAAGNKLIEQGVNADINLSNLVNNAGTVFAGIADTVRDVLMTINGPNFMKTAESLADDAISNIDWTATSNQILNELLAKGVSAAVANQLSQTVSQYAGPLVSSLLSTVQFDFSNLGQKLKNGEFDKIVKFDPTNIYIESPAIDVRGTLRFTKNDPVYGDSWQAEVLVRVKVPKKDNPIECSAFFLNGKTTGLTQNFTYWFVKLDVLGLNIPINPTPIIWDGADGYAFCKMKKTSPQNIVPDPTNKFGVGCRFYFYDQQSTGKTLTFNLGAEAAFNTGGFAIQLVGEASVMNFINQGGKYKAPGFITGTGTLGYYKTPDVSKVTGNFNVIFHTQPVICAGGDAGLDIRGPENWKVWVGTQQNPIGVKVLCKDFLSNTAFFEMGHAGFHSGLSMNVDLSGKSPWIQFSEIKIRGTASLQFGYNAYVSVQWDPAFTLNEATLSAWALASIGVEYQTAVNTGTVTLASVSLAGSLSYKSQPEAELHGNMSGNITVIGYNLGFDLPVHYSLSKKEIIN